MISISAYRSLRQVQLLPWYNTIRLLELTPTMNILWVAPSFLHPTDRGGQIRTLGTLRELHKRHDIHFAALNSPANTEGPSRSVEYASSYTAVEHSPPKRGSLGMLPQLAGSFLGDRPLAVSRYESAELRQRVEDLIETGRYDVIVCDFLAASPNIPDLSTCILF